MKPRSSTDWVWGAVMLALSACGDDGATEDPPCDPPPAGDERWFVDRAEELGVTFEHHMQSELCELTDTVGGPGTCTFDFDRDGDIDVYLVDRGGNPSALYRNDGDAFEDVAADLGVDAPGDAIGCLAFDYDGDDDTDLFVTTTGKDVLYENRGDHFEDVTDGAGLSEEASFSTSATAGDIDGDGDLDLFVGRLVKLETCPDACYLFPINCEAEQSLLYINQGGVFSEEASSRGITDAEPTLAVLFFDEDADGDLDLYVGNDMGVAFEDRLWVNDGTGHFFDGAEERGYTAAGTDTMGVDIGDYDGDGITEMVTTDFKMRPTRLYDCGDPELPCSFESLPRESSEFVRWGVALEDFDGDRDLDIFHTSGDVYDPELIGSPNQVFENADGRGRFEHVTPVEGDALNHLAIHRGAAFADLDGDHDIDVVVAVNGGRPKFLYNVRSRGHSVLVDAGPSAVGARVKATVGAKGGVGGSSIEEQVLIGGSFLGSSDPRVHFGLGEECTADIEVTYLDGRVSSGRARVGEVLVLR